MKNTKEYLSQKIKKNDVCVLALSGGPDSMCLLNLLLEEQKEKNIKIICVHVNHNTRENNKIEEEFVKNYVNEKKIILEYKKIENYEKGHFKEQEAREKRYKFFEEVMEKYNGTYLFTAHHGDDLTETILMRILRGSTIEGYAGIKKESNWEKIKLMRPLLNVTKKEILSYLKENDIPYVIDESNEQDIYLRNKIRHKILPVIEEINPNYVKKFLKLNEKLQKANKIIEKEVKKQAKKIIEDNKINLEEFKKIEDELKEEILMYYLKIQYKERINRITDKHLNLIEKMEKDSKEKCSLDLPDNRTLRKKKNYLWLEKKEKIEKYCIKLEEKVILPNGDRIEKITSYEKKSNFEIHLNSKEITFPLYIKTRENGMKISVKNLNGTKKVSDILINSKIPKEKKDEIPILVDSKGTVLWILGIKKSKYDLEKKENYDIIYKYIKKEGNYL